MIEKTKTGYYTSKITREMKIYAYEIIKQEEIKQKRYIDINKNFKQFTRKRAKWS